MEPKPASMMAHLNHTNEVKLSDINPSIIESSSKGKADDNEPARTEQSLLSPVNKQEGEPLLSTESPAKEELKQEP